MSPEPESTVRAFAANCLIDCHARVIEAEFQLAETALCGRYLTMSAGRLMPNDASRHDRWLEALTQVADTGTPRLFAVSDAPKRVHVGIVRGEHADTLMIRCERLRLCAHETIRQFCACAGLTRKETEVVQLLSMGHTPKAVAGSLNTGISTIRTHIKAVLSKTGAEGIRDLLITLSCLPSLGASRTVRARQGAPVDAANAGHFATQTSGNTGRSPATPAANAEIGLTGTSPFSGLLT